MADASTNTFLDIFINDEKVSSFEHLKDVSTTDYEYDVPVFANATLSAKNEQHYVVIANKANSVNNSLLMFDYAVYTCGAWLLTSYQLTNALAVSPITFLFLRQRQHRLQRTHIHSGLQLEWLSLSWFSLWLGRFAGGSSLGVVSTSVPPLAIPHTMTRHFDRSVLQTKATCVLLRPSTVLVLDF